MLPPSPHRAVLVRGLPAEAAADGGRRGGVRQPRGQRVRRRDAAPRPAAAGPDPEDEPRAAPGRRGGGGVGREGGGKAAPFATHGQRMPFSTKASVKSSASKVLKPTHPHTGIQCLIAVKEKAYREGFLKNVMPNI